MKRCVVLLALLVFLAVSLGLAQTTARPSSQKPALLVKGPDDLALEKRVAELERRLDSLGLLVDIHADELGKLGGGFAQFDPASPGAFQVVSSGNGALLLIFESAAPYLDGYRASLKVGNPWNMTFKGLSVKCSWGPRQKAAENYFEWFSGLKTKTDSVSNDFAPGRWSLLDLILPATGATDFGYLMVSLTSTTVSLGVPLN